MDLLAGMLLPSGNDAATALAEATGGAFEAPGADEPLFGCVCVCARPRVRARQFVCPAHAASSAGPHYAAPDPLQPEHPVCRFVAEMNRQARSCGMDSTVFANPHGLSHERHTSCAR